MLGCYSRPLVRLREGVQLGDHLKPTYIAEHPLDCLSLIEQHPKNKFLAGLTMFDTLTDKFSDAFKNISGKGKITEDNIEQALKEVRTALLEADDFKVVRSFINDVKEEAMGEKVIRGVNLINNLSRLFKTNSPPLWAKKIKKSTSIAQAFFRLLSSDLTDKGKLPFVVSSLFTKEKERQKSSSRSYR